MEVAKARIEGLNPLVAVQAMKHHTLLERESLDALVMSVDLVCVTDWPRERLVSGVFDWVQLHVCMDTDIGGNGDPNQRSLQTVWQAFLCGRVLWFARLHIL